MFCAGTTVAVLPLVAAQLAAACFTAAVSASPDDAIMIWMLAGPAFCVDCAELPENPLPHAAVSRRAPPSTAAPTSGRMSRDTIDSFVVGNGRRAASPGISDHQVWCEQDMVVGGAFALFQERGQQSHAGRGRLAQRL